MLKASTFPISFKINRKIYYKKKLFPLIQFILQFLFLYSPRKNTVLSNALTIFFIYYWIHFRVKSVPHQFFKKHFLHSSEILEDSNRFIIIHSSIFQLLRLRNFDWVQVLFSGKLEKHNNRTKTVSKHFQVVSSTSIKHLEVIVTNDVLFSISNQLSQRTISIQKKFLRKVENFNPKIAKKATIQLLEKFHLPDVNVIDDILFIYFSYPRFLNENDIFTVSLEQYFPEKFYSFKNYNINDLQCKVISITGEPYEHEDCGYLITNLETSLHQTKNYQGFLPPERFLEKVYVTSESNNKPRLGFILLYPDAFEVYFSQILSWCNLFIQNDYKVLQLLPLFCLSGPKGSGKTLLLSSVAKFLGLQYFKTDCIFFQTSTPGYAEAQLKNLFAKIKKCSPSLIHFSNFEALCVNATGNEDNRLILYFINNLNKMKNDWPVIILITCEDSSTISPSIARLFLETLVMESLNEVQRKSILLWELSQHHLELDSSSLEAIAKQTTGFLFADLINLVRQTILNIVKNQPMNEDDPKLLLKLENFSSAFKKIQSSHASKIGSPQIPAVSWEDVGGLASLKQEILRSLNSFSFSNKLRRSGLLLHGPPGTGKTLIAKAIATECNFNFLSIKGPELLNMYVGQSEQNVREVFSRALSASPCVIFFDELDSLAPNRGKNGDSGGVMDRVVSQLLAEMDQVQKAEGIFVLAATNRPDLIDPALLRPGRLDKLLYVGPCADEDSKLHVLKAVTRKFKLDENVDLARIVSHLDGKVTGADVSAICSAAWLNAARRIISLHEAQGDAKGKLLDHTVIVNDADFLQALGSCK